MTILQVVRDVCASVGVVVPTSVFAGIAANRPMQEMVACANEVAHAISDVRDWSVLKEFTTHGGFPTQPNPWLLPSTFLRMPITAQIWRTTSAQAPMKFISDHNEWIQRRAQGIVDAWGEWIKLGNAIHYWPELSETQEAHFVYIHNSPIQQEGSITFVDRFTNDTDRYIVNERLLKLGMIAKWKQWKGSPYAEDFAAFENALATAGGFDTPSPIIIDRVPSSWNAGVAYPFQVPT